MSACSICNADNVTELEQFGLAAQAGEISWREAARRGQLKHHTPLKRHIENHYVDLQEKAVEAEVMSELDEVILGLRQAAHTAPATVKPLYYVAIHNLEELKNTKPSQQHLIQALKTIQEMTGMRTQQTLMLQFAEAMFRPIEGTKPKASALPAALDVEEVA